MGVAIVGLVAALGGTFHLTAVSRTDAAGDLLLVRYAEALGAAAYEPCRSGSTPYQSAAIAAIPSGGLPPGVTAVPLGSGDGAATTFEVGLESTAYWGGDTAPASFAPSCGALDRGSEELHLRVRSGDGEYDRRLTIVKRVS